MRLGWAIAVGALLATGCDSGGQQAQQAKSISVRSAEQEAMHKLTAFNRAIALKRAIYDSGYRCKRVTRSGFVGGYKNLDMWMVRCADGRDWAVFTGPDGSAQVRDCGDVASFGLPKCEFKSEDSGEGGGEPEDANAV